MSDDRFNDAVRDALLTDDPGAVPARLRARMAMIPDEGRASSARTRRERLTALAVPAAVLAAVLVVAVYFGGIALRGQQTASAVPTIVPTAPPSPGTSPAPSPSATASPSGTAAASPSATPLPTPAPSGPLTIDPASVTSSMPGTFAVKDGVAYVSSLSDTASHPTLLRLDLATSTSTVLAQLKNGHEIGAAALTDAGIVWEETWYTQKAINCTGVPCSAHMGQPVSWAVNLTTLDGRTTTRLDAGVVSRTSVEGEGAGPLPPAVAAQGDRVAYAIPRTNVAGMPEASQILVRSLPDGSLVRKIDTDGYVAQVSLFGQAIAYRDALDTAGPASVFASDATLYATASDGQPPAEVAAHVAEVVVGDGGTGGALRIAWAPYDLTSGSIRVGDLTGAKPTEVPVPANAGGAAWSLNLVGDGVAWLVWVPDSTGATGAQAIAWQPGWGIARPIPSLGLPDLGSSNGQLLVSSANSRVTPGNGVGVIPASALFGTAP